MEKSLVNPIDKNATPKMEQSVETFLPSEQEKNIQEVFKFSPELKEIACDGLGIENDIKVQIINQRIDSSNGNMYTSLNVYYKGNKIIDTEHEVDSKSLFKLCSLKDGATFVSAVLLPEQLRGQGLYSKILQETANAINQKIKDSSTVFEDDLEIDYSISPSAKKVWDKLGNEIVPNYEAEKLYAKYIETIFPESKVKDIVYHSSPNKIDEFLSPEDEEYTKQQSTSTGCAGIYFSDNKNYTKRYITTDNMRAEGYTYPVLLNIKNPLIASQRYDDGFTPNTFSFVKVWHIDKEFKNYLDVNNFDSVISGDFLKNTTNRMEYVVLNPSQIHILGSKDDIERFKEFVSKNENK